MECLLPRLGGTLRKDKFIFESDLECVVTGLPSHMKPELVCTFQMTHCEHSHLPQASLSKAKHSNNGLVSQAEGKELSLGF